MSAAEAAPLTGLGSVPYTAAQARVVTAALDLFARHGVGGTSLGMIAEALGVTKAAVYYQYRTKDEIVIAAAEANLAKLEHILDAAEAQAGRPEGVDLLLVQLVDLAVEQRRMVNIIQGDPVMIRLIAEHEPFRTLMGRLHRLLVGDDPGADLRVPAAMLTAAIGSAATHPLVADLDDDTLRAKLLDLARRFLDLPT
ncbi:MAG TPA: helix-turn-helix domain-containing protein [Acidimicrobiales bacterium]|nr:helix-turn-helix domain-containing protein [Acidimicrobiales bacterium]